MIRQIQPRNQPMAFMNGHVNQVVRGVFVEIFAYRLGVLRTIRGRDEGSFAIPPGN